MQTRRKANTVTVRWTRRELDLPADEPLHRSLAAAGVPVESPCGGLGRCGRCRVLFLTGAPAPSEADRRLLSGADLEAGWRLSCRHLPRAGAEITLTPSWTPAALAAAGPGGATLPAAVKGATEAGAVTVRSPLVESRTVVLPRPAAEETGGDVERLAAALGRPLRAGLPALREGALHLRRGGELRCVLGDGELLAVAGAAGAGQALGLCLDLGTTTLAGYLLALDTGHQLAGAAIPNPQASLGADIMTRLGHALRGNGLAELRLLLVEGANRLLESLCRQAESEPDAVWAVTAVGNSAMHHLFLGLPVDGLAAAPYAPLSTAPRLERAADLGLACHPRGLVYLPPLLGGFAGSDMAAVLLATRPWEAERPVLVLDLGTNGEVLLGHEGRVLTASAPAGPAFEGAGLSAGLRAGPGAITAVDLATVEGEVDLTVEVVGGGPPQGICGSGAVDAAAALLRAGLVDASGRIAVDRLSSLPARLAARIRPEGAGAVTLAHGPGGPVLLTQGDLRQLQLAKAAVRAACDLLLAEGGLEPDDLGAVLLAGAFGNYLRPESALAIGLLPPVPPERVVPVGNAAGVGAMLCLLDGLARSELEERARRVRHVPLATHPDFQDRFLAATWFPSPGGPPAPADRPARPAAAGTTGSKGG